MFENEQPLFDLDKFFSPTTKVKAIRIIVIVGIIVFFNCLFNNFVWDDVPLIRDNPFIHSAKNIPKIILGGNFATNSGHDLVGAYYRPILSFSYLLIYSLFGNTPFFFHLFQIIIHTINAILFYLFFVKVFQKQLVALFLALLFLIHPIQVEAVAYSAALQEPLFFFFGFFAVILASREKVTHKNALTISFLFLCSLLSKETAILFMIVIPISRSILQKNGVKRLLVYELLAIFFYCLIRFVVAGFYFPKLQTPIPISFLPLVQRLLNIPAIIFFYLKTFFVPINLVINQLWVVKAVTFDKFYLPLMLDVFFFLALAVIGWLLFISDKRRFRLFAFFFLWFLLGLGIHLQFLPLDLTVSDRWFYFPIVGLLGMLGILIEYFLTKNKDMPFLFYQTVAVVILLLFSIRTITRNAYWYDELTLYTHDSKIMDNFEIENHLGYIYLSQEQYAEALKHFDKSIKMLPYRFNLYNEALTYDRLDNFQKAEEYYQKTIEVNRNSWDTLDSPTAAILPNTYKGLAKVLLFQRKSAEAREVTKSGLQKYPQSAPIWLMLALSEYTLHNQKAALSDVAKAKMLEPTAMTDAISNAMSNNQPVEMDGNQSATHLLLIGGQNTN